MNRRRAWPLLLMLVAVAGLRAVYAGADSARRISPPQIERGQFEVQGVRLEAAAYIDHRYSDSSRYAVKIITAPTNSHNWELYGLDEFYSDRDEPELNQSYGGIAQPPYQEDQLEAFIDCDLRQYESQEERVTFHNLDFTQQMGLKFLTLDHSQSVTTPSGIKITLPKQDSKTYAPRGMFVYDGPPDVMFVKFHITPGDKRNVLPQSALYNEYHVPVSIALFAADPVFMNSNSMDCADPVLTLTPPDRKATHLDSLTIVVRQRAYLQDIPLILRVPIDRQPPMW